MSATESNENQVVLDHKSDQSNDSQNNQNQVNAQANHQETVSTHVSNAQPQIIQPASRLSQRNIVKTKESGGNGPEQRSFTSAIQTSRGIGTVKSTKLELTDAERELLLLGEFSTKAASKQVESLGSSQGTPTNGNLVKRKTRGNDPNEPGFRSRRFKSNYHDDFVYDDIIVRKQINQKDTGRELVGTSNGQSLRDIQQVQSQSTLVHGGQSTINNKLKKSINKKPKPSNVQIVKESQQVLQPQIIVNQQYQGQATNQIQEQIKLYCICRTADESSQMIGCDKCDEWYHFECVGIDPVFISVCFNLYLQSTIPDLESYEFICPECQKKASKSNQSKKSQLSGNKRNIKAAAKTQNQTQINSSNTQIKILPQNQQVLQHQQSSASNVSQKRKFQKNRSGAPQLSASNSMASSHHGGNPAANNRKGINQPNGNQRTNPTKKVLGMNHTNNIPNGRMVLNTNLGESSIYEDEDHYMEEEGFNEYQDDQRSGFDGSSEIIPSNTDRRGQSNLRNFDPNEVQQKRMNDNNIEKVVQKGDYLYFISKDGRDKPLEQNFKMPVPDRRLEIKEDSIQNLKNLLLKNPKKEDFEEKKNSGVLGEGSSNNESTAALQQQKSTIQTLLEILKAKFQKNLKQIPSAYSYPSLIQTNGNGLINEVIYQPQQKQQAAIPQALFNQE
ncbi:transcription factor jumonji [Stylonychia lemnae]|uniref:Transcription factor jumonji n=1 Tax=Stylonychia lemnae TaxID=5949 RepID=A0A078AF57_STYLE|nr:transcription factor jumonji [Stylonychia lemnae]|eukprot:CDW80850.1 transcription factor jumonji [Stylonychia lemnae]